MNALLAPKSIAVIGASAKEGSVGHGIMLNLLKGTVFENPLSTPFSGSLYAVNPNASEVLGVKAYPTIHHVPGRIDLAVIAVPALSVPNVVRECAQRKVSAAIIVSAGFSELGEQGRVLQKEIDSNRGTLRVIGPNCLGVIRPGVFNASFAPTTPTKGDIAFISQSGALVDSVIDWSLTHKIGFSSIISYGNASDLGLADFLEMLSQDPETKSIALYVESIPDGERFMRVAAKVSRKKPIVALKAGKTAEGSGAISSHTGSLAGDAEVYAQAFRQSGVVAVERIEDLFHSAKALSLLPRLSGPVAIITNGGGCGVLAADACSELGLPLATLSEKTLRALDRSGAMHHSYSRRNPLDLIGDALPVRYDVALNAVLADKAVGGVLVIQTLQTMTDSVSDANIVVRYRKKYSKKPVVCCFMGGPYTKPGIDILEKNGVPNFNDPARAARVMRALRG